MGLWIRDFRFALRSLARVPGFSIVVLLTLALGIGANAAIFSIVDGVLLRPLPFRDAQRLVLLFESDRLRGTTQEGFSAPDFFDVAERNEVFQGLALFQTPSATLTGASGEPARVATSLVSAGFHALLGSEPLLGRTFYDGEDAPGGDRVALLSHRLWMGRFGGDPSVVGQRIFLDGVSTEIVGVMGAEFRFPTGADLWIPAQVTATNRPRGNHGFGVVARLQEGSSLDRANANLEAIAGALEAEYPDDNQGRGMWAQSFYDASVGAVRTSLLVLLGAVLLVLLIACANVANLFFARALGRQRETAIRSAMGAGQPALLRQSLAESLVLSSAGGLLGVLVAYWGLDALLALVPSDLPRVANVGVNGTVIVFALVVSVSAGLVFALVPTLQISRRNLICALKEGSGAGDSRTRHRTRKILVTVEVALAVILVIGAGLLMTSFWKLLEVDPGFTPANVLSVDLQLPASRYAQDRSEWPRWPAVQHFQAELAERVAASPGIDAVALAINGPLDAGWTSRFTIEGRADVAPGEQEEVRVRVVSPDYFRTVGIPVVRGRPLERGDDHPDARPVILINEAFARRYFVDEEPVGARLSQWGLTREIVGVVKDVKFQGLEADTAPAIYPTFSQAPFPGFSLLVRTREAPEKSFEQIREIVWSLDRDLALSSFTTLEERLSATVAGSRFSMILFAMFAALALLLAALGIYGVMSYSVSQRTHEIGVRMSLGAARKNVLGLVLGEGARIAGLGILLGIAAAMVLTRALETLLFGVGRLDARTFAAVSLLAAVVALAACYVPALRATRVDPISTLRQD